MLSTVIVGRETLLELIAPPRTGNRDRHRHPAAPRGDGEGEAAVGVALVADAVFGQFVPHFLALPLAEEQAGGVQVGEVVAERFVRNARAGFEGGGVGTPPLARLPLLPPLW